MGNECADHASPLGALGFVCSHNVNTRWSHPSFDTSDAVRDCNDLDEIQQCLRDARSEHTHTHTCAVPRP